MERPDNRNTIVIWDRFDRDIIIEDLFAVLDGDTDLPT